MTMTGFDQLIDEMESDGTGPWVELLWTYITNGLITERDLRELIDMALDQARESGRDQGRD